MLAIPLNTCTLSGMPHTYLPDRDRTHMLQASTHTYVCSHTDTHAGMPAHTHVHTPTHTRTHTHITDLMHDVIGSVINACH